METVFGVYGPDHLVIGAADGYLNQRRHLLTGVVYVTGGVETVGLFQWLLKQLHGGSFLSPFVEKILQSHPGGWERGVGSRGGDAVTVPSAAVRIAGEHAVIAYAMRNRY